MIQRKLKQTVLNSLQHYPVVAIVGARQVGKTTLSQMIKREFYQNAVYLDLERPSDFDKLADAELYLEHYSDKLVIIDEIQRLPSLFPLLRTLTDSYKRNACFLILGSASPNLKRQSSESLAGRVIYHELSPLLLAETEYDSNSIETLWLRGGYPLSYLSKTDRLSFEWRDALITTYLERDIPQLGIKIPAIQLRRFWQILAHFHGQLWNASKIAGSLGATAPTARHYLDLLKDTFIVRQLLPYYLNIKKRLVKSPKICLRDSGLLHSLLGIHNIDELLGHPSAGSSWEGWVIEQILGIMPKLYYDSYFYRTSGGAEMDLVIVRGNTPPLCIEIKRTLSPSISKSFRQAFSDLQSGKGFVVYPGKEYYPLLKNVFALPATSISKIFEDEALHE